MEHYQDPRSPLNKFLFLQINVSVTSVNWLLMIREMQFFGFGASMYLHLLCMFSTTELQPSHHGPLIWICLKHIWLFLHALLYRDLSWSASAQFSSPLEQPNRQIEVTSWIAKIKITDYPVHSLGFLNSVQSQPCNSWKKLRTLCNI
jgi:hypothetical protein